MFTEIKFSSLSDAALAELIQQAMSEFQRRMQTTGINTVKTIDTPPVVLHSPSDNELIFIRNCLSKIRGGQYVHAEMKDRYRNLSKKYAQWFESKGIPSDLRGSSSLNYIDYFVDKK